MAYRDTEARKAASKRHYQANKPRYFERNKRYRAAIRDFVQKIKEASACKDCGKQYPYYVMDFDHLEGKENAISFLSATGRIGALKKEIKKCEVVCANCHRERTNQRFKKITSARSSVD